MGNTNVQKLITVLCVIKSCHRLRRICYRGCLEAPFQVYRMCLRNMRHIYSTTNCKDELHSNENLYSKTNNIGDRRYKLELYGSGVNVLSYWTRVPTFVRFCSGKPYAS